MCTFLVINISSLQLIPTNILAYRSQYGRDNPSAILGAAILATFISTLVGILFCKIMQGMTTVIQILPTLIGLMVAVGVLRASGFLEYIASIANSMLE